MAGRPKIFSVRGCGGRLIANIARQSRGQRWIGFPRMSVSDCCAGCNKTKSLTTGGTEGHSEAQGEEQMLSCVFPSRLSHHYLSHFLCHDDLLHNLLPPNLVLPFS